MALKETCSHERLPCPYAADELKERCGLVLDTLHVTPGEIRNIEQLARGQSTCPLWHQVQQKRITGSKCGRILTQVKVTPALLRDVSYRKPFLLPPAPVAWAGA